MQEIGRAKLNLYLNVKHPSRRDKFRMEYQIRINLSIRYRGPQKVIAIALCNPIYIVVIHDVAFSRLIYLLIAEIFSLIFIAEINSVIACSFVYWRI